MPVAHFMAVFGPYAARIDQILDRFGPADSPPQPRASPTATTKSPCARRNAPHDEHNRDHSTQRQRRSPRSPARTSAARAGFRAAGPHGTPPCSTTTCGISPTSIGLPVQMALYRRRFDFTAISDPRWRLVVKEYVLALLAPSHPRSWSAAPRLPRPPAPDQLLQPALRGGQVDELGWPPSGDHPRSPASTPGPLRPLPGGTALRIDADGTVVGTRKSSGVRAPPPLSSSSWSTTGTCCPPTGYRDGFTPGTEDASAGRRHASGRRRTRRPSCARRSSSRCSPRRSTPGYHHRPARWSTLHAQVQQRAPGRRPGSGSRPRIPGDGQRPEAARRHAGDRRAAGGGRDPTSPQPACRDGARRPAPDVSLTALARQAGYVPGSARPH